MFSTFPYGSLTAGLCPGMGIIIFRRFAPIYDALYSPDGSAGATFDVGEGTRFVNGPTGYKASFCAFLLLRKPRLMVDRIAFVGKRSRWKFNVQLSERMHCKPILNEISVPS